MLYLQTIPFIIHIGIIGHHQHHTTNINGINSASEDWRYIEQAIDCDAFFNWHVSEWRHRALTLPNIGSDNVFTSILHQAITWTYIDLPIAIQWNLDQNTKRFYQCAFQHVVCKMSDISFGYQCVNTHITVTS